MKINPTFKTSCTLFGGGSDAVTGTGSTNLLTGAGSNPTPGTVGNELAGDRWGVLFTDDVSQTQYQVGFGDLTGSEPVFCFTYANKVYTLHDSTVSFSEIGNPLSWNNEDGTGNGSVTISNFYQNPEPLVAIAPYQGRLAFFSRWTVQIWNINADPAAWSLSQVLPNTGTMAPMSVQSLGELDVLYLSDTGIRSLRVKNASLNAYVEDLGSPLDSVIQTSLITTPSGGPTACGIIEPTSGRYWLYLNGTIYVFSYNPSSKVAAWSTYEPKDENLATFVPVKFVTYNGQVYCRATINSGATDVIYQYGGSTGLVYDANVATMETAWVDVRSPGTRKMATGFDCVLTGAWAIEAGMDPQSGLLDAGVYTSSASSYDIGIVPWSSQGTHFKVKAYTTGSTAALFSQATVHYDTGDET